MPISPPRRARMMLSMIFCAGLLSEGKYLLLHFYEAMRRQPQARRRYIDILPIFCSPTIAQHAARILITISMSLTSPLCLHAMLKPRHTIISYCRRISLLERAALSRQYFRFHWLLSLVASIVTSLKTFRRRVFLRRWRRPAYRRRFISWTQHHRHLAVIGRLALAAVPTVS